MYVLCLCFTAVLSAQWAGPGLAAGRGQPPVTVTKRTSAASDGMAQSPVASLLSTVLELYKVAEVV